MAFLLATITQLQTKYRRQDAPHPVSQSLAQDHLIRHEVLKHQVYISLYYSHLLDLAQMHTGCGSFVLRLSRILCTSLPHCLHIDTITTPPPTPSLYRTVESATKNLPAPKFFQPPPPPSEMPKHRAHQQIVPPPFSGAECRLRSHRMPKTSLRNHRRPCCSPKQEDPTHSSSVFASPPT